MISLFLLQPCIKTTPGGSLSSTLLMVRLIQINNTISAKVAVDYQIQYMFEIKTENTLVVKISETKLLNFYHKGFSALLSSFLLLFLQHFGRYILQPSSGVCRTREHSRNFELRPLLKPRGSPVLIPLAITGYKC